MRFLLLLLVCATSCWTTLSAQKPDLNVFEGTMVLNAGATYTGTFTRANVPAKMKETGKMLKIAAPQADGSTKDTLIDPKDVYSLTIGDRTWHSVITTGIDGTAEISERLDYLKNDKVTAGLYNPTFAWEGYSWGDGIYNIVSSEFAKTFRVNGNPNKKIAKTFTGCPDMVAKAGKKAYTGKTKEGAMEIFADYKACLEQ